MIHYSYQRTIWLNSMCFMKKNVRAEADLHALRWTMRDREGDIERRRRKNGIWKAWESINANYSCIYLYISTQSELYGKDGIYSKAVFSIWLIFYGEKQNDEREKYTNKWNYIHRERIFLATLLITFLRSNRIVPMRTSNSPTRTTNVWCVN